MFSDIEPLTYQDILHEFLLLLFAKMGRQNVPPNDSIEKCCKLLDICGLA